MKKTFFTLLMVFSVLCTFGQAFEGKIVYSMSYKTKNPAVSIQQLETFMGTSQDYFFKDGNYKSVTNGRLMEWQLYVNADNKLYTKMASSEKALWNDASVQGDEVLKSEINKGVIEILGYTCDELVLTCKSGIQKYYFNSKINVDPKLFAGHKFGNWYAFVSLSKALPLKTIIETDQFVLTSTATTLLKGKQDASLFQLPAGVETEKSPY